MPVRAPIELRLSRRAVRSWTVLAAALVVLQLVALMLPVPDDVHGLDLLRAELASEQIAPDDRERLVTTMDGLERRARTISSIHARMLQLLGFTGMQPRETP